MSIRGNRGNAQTRRALFVMAYLTNGRNATRAAEAAGFSPKSAAKKGSDLLQHMEVAAAVAAASSVAVAALEQRAGMTIGETMDRLAHLARADVRSIAKWDGQEVVFHPSDSLAPEVAFTVGEVGAKIDERIKSSDDGKSDTMFRTTQLKVKMRDPLGALKEIRAHYEAAANKVDRAAVAVALQRTLELVLDAVPGEQGMHLARQIEAAFGVRA